MSLEYYMAGLETHLSFCYILLKCKKNRWKQCLPLLKTDFSPYVEGPIVIQFCPVALQHYGLPITFKRSFDQVIALFAL